MIKIVGDVVTPFRFNVRANASDRAG